MEEIKLLGVRLSGVQARLVEVVVQKVPGVRDLEVVGLNAVATKEMRARVLSALRQYGYDFQCRYKATLTSVDGVPLRGDAGALDLPVALGVLAATNCVDVFEPQRRLCWGELTMAGDVRQVRGELAFRRFAGRTMLSPFTASTLAEAVKYAPGLTSSVFAEAPPVHDAQDAFVGHHVYPMRKVLLVGTPGVGKTTFARALRHTMPALTDAEVADLAVISDAAGMRRPGVIIDGPPQRPFRAPHHTCSEVALVGGGDPIRPGEVTLAHGGTLLLDEVCEWRKAALDALGVVLKTGVSVVSRSHETVFMPAKPLLVVAAMNPCVCGWHGDARRECRCSEAQVAAWNARVPAWLRDADTKVVQLPCDPTETDFPAVWL